MRTRPSPRASSIRLLALTFACLIVADLSLDGNCDPLPASASGDASVSVATPDGTGVACVSQCLPDCFCCSRGLAPAAGVLPPSGGPGVPAAEAASLAAPAGVLPLPYHPPQLLA